MLALLFFFLHFSSLFFLYFSRYFSQIVLIELYKFPSLHPYKPKLNPSSSLETLKLYILILSNRHKKLTKLKPILHCKLYKFPSLHPYKPKLNRSSSLETLKLYILILSNRHKKLTKLKPILHCKTFFYKSKPYIHKSL